MAASPWRCIAVGAAWGCTNPLIRRGTAAQEHAGSGGAVDAAPHEDMGQKSGLQSMAAPLRSLVRIQALIPYAINQSGSLLYYWLLSTADMAVAVPACNSLALVFTTLTAAAIGEPVAKPLQTALGIVLILTGVTLCVMANRGTPAGN
eukprot:TRINITY_DN19145_c0_g1_i1.p1 TRINITY_DN19145_c0_g1~~TRINITY_DN19145_c0_g1_i1.p1  ORF type:complete len:148 (+),score=15.78 TRINITY_DN19145_c0_g1_i1:26-469(+)